MPELVPWGYGGIQLAQQHQMNQQLMDYRALDMQGKQQALDAGQAEQEINQQAAQMFQRLASGEPVRGPDGSAKTASNPAEAFDTVGSTMLAVGQPNKALDFFKAAGALRDSQAKAQKDILDRQETKYDIISKQADMIGTNLGGATNANEWNQGIQAMQEQANAGMIPQELVDQVKSMPFSPAVAKHFRDSALSVKDKASLDMQAHTAAVNEASKAAQENYNNLRLKQEQQKIDAAAEAKRNKEKTGAIASAPTNAQIAEAEGVISSLILGDNTPTKPKTGEGSISYQAFQAGASAVANRAAEMLQEIPGLTRNEALSRAALESQAAGDWDIQEDRSGVEIKFQGAGKSPDDALPMPTKDNQPALDKVKKNKWYDINGKKAQYLGDGNWNVLQ